MKKVSTFLILLFVIIFSANAKSLYKTITLEELKDKVAGGWAGKMIGVSRGHLMEYKACGKMFDEDIPWTSDMVKESLQEDDLYGQINLMMTMEKSGLYASTTKLAEDLANAKFSLCHANLQCRKNYIDGIMPPLSGNPKYNMHADDIDFQIDADFIGFMNPGMPLSSAKMCNRIGRMMAYGDGLYGGIFISSMHSLAFFNNDPERLVVEALKTIPARSSYAKCINDVINQYRANPDDWQKTWHYIWNKWGNIDICVPFMDFDIDAKINGAFIVIGLLYGHGDFDKTMRITIGCGQDTDCNSSNVTAILGVMKGYSNIPDIYKSDIPLMSNDEFSYTTYSYNKTVAQTIAFLNENIKANGGKINGDIYTIKTQEPCFKGKLEQSFPNMYMNYFVQVRDSAQWRFKGNWQNFVYGDGDPDLFKMTNEPGASMEIPFDGTGVTVLGSWNVDGGRANVYVDGKFVKKIDTYYREDAGKYNDNRSHIFHILGLNPGKHSLRLVVTDDSNPKSTGHKIWIERIVVYSTRNS
jgi:hypothetical protein